MLVCHHVLWRPMLVMNKAQNSVSQNKMYMLTQDRIGHLIMIVGFKFCTLSRILVHHAKAQQEHLCWHSTCESHVTLFT